MILVNEKEQEQLSMIIDLINLAAKATKKTVAEIITETSIESLSRMITKKRHFSVQAKRSLYNYLSNLLDSGKIGENKEEFKFLLAELDHFKQEKPWASQKIVKKVARKKRVALVMSTEEESQLQIVMSLIEQTGKKVSEIIKEAKIGLDLYDAIAKICHLNVGIKAKLYNYLSSKPIKNNKFKSELKELKKFRNERPWAKRKAAEIVEDIPRKKQKVEIIEKVISVPVIKNLSPAEAQQLSVIAALIEFHETNGIDEEKIFREAGVSKTMAGVLRRERHLTPKEKNKLLDYFSENPSKDRAYKKLLGELKKFKDSKPWTKAFKLQHNNQSTVPSASGNWRPDFFSDSSRSVSTAIVNLQPETIPEKTLPVEDFSDIETEDDSDMDVSR